jgi:sugar lactone lactonase YvrE
MRLLPVLLVGLAATVAAAGEVLFTRPPSATATPDGVRIEFAVDKPTDIEVAVVGRAGKVVRHLAAGVVGRPKAAPPLKPSRLRQSLIWDGKDDDGKPVGGPVTVRVRAGMAYKLGRIIGTPARLTGKVYGLATDPKGNLYVASGGVFSTPVFSIKVFDRRGKYLRTILPFAADLPAERVVEYGGAEVIDGHLAPANHDPLVPYVHRGGIVTFLGNQVRGGRIWLLNTEGRICRITTDGTAVAWRAAPRTLRPSGGPMCWAVAPDGKTLFLTGHWNSRATRSKGQVPFNDGVIYRVDPATGKAAELLRIEMTEDHYWHKETNGWYHFRNWGRKNGCAALHGIAVDAENRLYVCDRVHQRLSVYDTAGKLVGSTAIQWPDLVTPAPAGQTVYVVTRRIIDGYKATNEFRIVKLSKAVDGKVLAELTLRGSNAPSMAVDATTEPAVIWLSNVGKDGAQLVRVEDRGDKLVLTGTLNEDLPAAKAVVKLWADPHSDDVYVNDGWSGLSRYNGRSGEGGPIPITAIDLAVGPDRNLYLYGRKGWNEPIYRCDRQFKPVNFSGTGKPTTTKCTTGRPVYGRYGTGWSNKGLVVTRDGRIFVRHMYDWNKYYVSVFAADGTAEKHDRIADGILGPLDGASGGLRIDREGNFYIGMDGHPKGLPRARRMESCVVKVRPTGGGRVPKGAKAEGLAWPDGSIVEGATLAYPYLAPHQTRGCVCKEARFDLDEFGRLFVPNVLDFCIRVYDNAGNLVTRLGHYGNADSTGVGGGLERPAIPLGWPMTCGVNRAGRLYVGDVLNQRIVRLDPTWAAEATANLQGDR